MKIEVTELTRADGMQACTYKNDWIIRRRDGVCQFYQPVFGTWVVAHALETDSINPDKDERTCLLTFKQAMDLLATLPPLQHYWDKVPSPNG